MRAKVWENGLYIFALKSPRGVRIAVCKITHLYPQSTFKGVYRLSVNEINEVIITLMIVKMIY